MKRREIWVVESGSYSDYRIHAAFPDKATAKAAAALGDQYHVASLPELTMADLSLVIVLRMDINIWDDGTESQERANVRTEVPFDMLYPEDEKPAHWRWVRAPIHENKGGRLEVSGTDHERVRKLYTELRGRLHAEDAFRMKKEARR